MPSASPRRKHRRKTVADVQPHEVPWRWQALTMVILLVLISAVISESDVYHRQSASPAGPGHIDINFASQEQLESLPGIGPALAAAIIAARPFSSAEDLARTRGVGSRLAAKLRPLVKAARGRRSADLR